MERIKKDVSRCKERQLFAKFEEAAPEKETTEQQQQRIEERQQR